MLEEALKVFGLNNVCSLKDLDIIYKKMVRKNYEENFPYNKEIGLMNVRIYEWSYQIILPFAILVATRKFQKTNKKHRFCMSRVEIGISAGKQRLKCDKFCA